MPDSKPGHSRVRLPPADLREQAAALRAFGENLRGLRTARGLTQQQLAARGWCGDAFVSALERDAAKPTLFRLLDLAEVLDAPVSSLLTNVRAPRSAESAERLIARARRHGGVTYNELARALDVRTSYVNLPTRRLREEGRLKTDGKRCRPTTGTRDAPTGHWVPKGADHG